MSIGTHPDFIEIDAASHTGVDNVRQIIEAASLLPVMGRKKVYLIDEAHMLSKAAFNAFLKILEEPPMGVLFILATTDVQKIIDTVRSRCFQLFFKPIDDAVLVNHLATLCSDEKITYDQEGLQLIVRNSQGSVRDAINMLEQVRYSSVKVSSKAVKQVLGHLDDDVLIQLLRYVFKGDQQGLLAYYANARLATFDAAYIWKQLVELARTMLWIKHGVAKSNYVHANDEFDTLLRECSLTQIQAFIDHLYTQEIVFMRTTSQHALLEMILLHMCYKNRTHNNSGTPPAAMNSAISAPRNTDEDEELVETESDQTDVSQNQEVWQRYVHQIKELHDPILTSLFAQAVPKRITSDGYLVISMNKQLALFKDMLFESRSLWLPVLQRVYHDCNDIVAEFDQIIQHAIQPTVQTASVVEKNDVKPKVQIQPARTSYDAYTKKDKKIVSYGASIDVSAKADWPITHKLLHHFPGTVTDITKEFLV